MQRWLSVIVPVYNVGLYIKECVDSLMKHNCKNIEFILVNDGSLDNSIDIIGECKNLANILIVHERNGGQGSARDLGIELIKNSPLRLLIDALQKYNINMLDFYKYAVEISKDIRV